MTATGARSGTGKEKRRGSLPMTANEGIALDKDRSISQEMLTILAMK